MGSLWFCESFWNFSKFDRYRIFSEFFFLFFDFFNFFYLGNAIKFTHSGYVYIRVFQVENNIRIEVKDTGIGIDSSSMGLLYRPFTQVDGSRTRRHTGTGLGLW